VNRIVAAAGILILTACARPDAKPVEDLGGGQDVSQFALTSLLGRRNGDRLDVRAVYGGPSGELTVDLRFRVTPPTRLQEGTWAGFGNGGVVRERSSTFLGGQSGPPSIGGRFDLLARDGRPLYRVTIPLQVLKEPFVQAQAEGLYYKSWLLCAPRRFMSYRNACLSDRDGVGAIRTAYQSTTLPSSAS
jgi:hypothetical protein